MAGPSGVVAMGEGKEQKVTEDYQNKVALLLVIPYRSDLFKVEDIIVLWMVPLLAIHF